MRPAIIVLLIVLAAMPAMGAKDATSASAGSLQLSLLKYEPIPTHPGDIVDVWVKLDNTGGDVQKNLRLEFLDNYPFKLDNEDRRVHSLGSLAGGYDYVAKYTVRVDPSAPIGQAFIKTRYVHVSSGRQADALLPIDVESEITSLSIESVRTEPPRLEQGQQGEIIIQVRNLANSVIRDIIANIELDSDDAPFAPVDSSTEIKVSSLAFGQSYEFRFRVIAQLDAEANAYKIPLHLSFKDDTGEITEYDQLVGVLVSANPDLILTVDSSEIYSDEPSGRLTLKFVNKGVDEIKFVYFTLLPSENYELLSPANNYYVGNIDTDDYEVEEIIVKANSPPLLEIHMEIEYRDAANQIYKRTETVNVKLVKKEEIEGKESKKGTYFVVILLFGGAGFYYWKKKKR